MSAARIVGIVLVRNEDLFVETAVRNIVAFCDEIRVADHGSTDATPRILRSLAGSSPKIHVESISHPAASHELIRNLSGSATWVFGVDGDEIYEPDRLARLRQRILRGEFDRHWMLLGNVLHATKLSPDRRTASGHFAPPCRSMTKLYNFNAIESWNGYTPERLHGGKVRFRGGFAPPSRLMLYKEIGWEKADFRCLHLCFLERSSRDNETAGRRNIMETFGPTRLHTVCYGLAEKLGFRKSGQWKRSRYMRGPEMTVPVGEFFPE